MQQEKKESFNRQEIKTMAKDVGRLREEEARKERERIAALQAEAKRRVEQQPREQGQTQGAEKKDWPALGSQKPSQAKGAVPPSELREVITPQGIIRPSSQRPERVCPSDKVLMRISVALILILIFVNMFLFWKWYLREPPAASLVEAPIQQLPPKTPPPSEPLPTPILSTSTEAIIPSAFFPIQASTTLEISDLEELPGLIQKVVDEQPVKDVFTRILIKDIEENKFLGLNDFWQEFAANTPPGFYEKVKNDFTLFVFGQNQGNRLGYVAEIADKQGLSELLLGWEKTMETDLEKLFLLLGKQSPALSPYFRQTSYKGAVVRYQTFSRQDLGICYGLVNDKYFVFTTSWTGLLKTIDKLVEKM